MELIGITCGCPTKSLISKPFLRPLSCYGNICPACGVIMNYALCGAQEWADDDYGGVLLYGTCDREFGHSSPWHSELRDGKLWASWRGPNDERAPTEARDDAD